MDGKLFLNVINLMESHHTFPQPDSVKERFDVIAKFLDEHYQTSTGSLIRYQECWKGKKFELAKVAVLLLSAYVLLNVTSSSQNAIGPLTNLDESVQMEIHECLQAVVLNLDGLKLSAEFVTVLSQQSPPAEQISSKSPTLYKNSTPVIQNSAKRFPCRNRLAFAQSTWASPLKNFLDSPQLVAKVAGKEIASLRSRLLSEQLRTTELETELRKLHDKVDDKAKEEQELRKIIVELRQYRDSVSSLEEYKTVAEQQGIKIEKLLSRIKELEEYKNTSSYLETDNKNLLKENMKLEQNVRQVDTLHKTIDQISQKNHCLIEQLKTTECLNIDYENQISQLQEDLLSAKKELEYFQQLYKEKIDLSKASNSSISSESYESGECLVTAFTEIELSEVKSQFSELQKELQEQKKENKSVLQKNSELSDTVTSLTESIEKLTNEKSKLEEEMGNKIHMQEEVNRALSNSMQILKMNNTQLETDCQKVKEENSNLQSILDCLQKTSEKLYEKLNHLSSENNNIQQSHAHCSEELESSRRQLKEATNLYEEWKQKCLSIEEKYNGAMESYNAKEEALCLQIAEVDNRLKVTTAEKENEILAANAIKISLENIIREKETRMKEQEERYTSMVLSTKEEKDCIYKSLNHAKQMLTQLENKNQLAEKELYQKISDLVFEKENVLCALKEVQSCYNQKVKEMEEKSLVIEKILHEKDILNANIAALKEIGKSNDSTIEQLSTAKKNLEEKLMKECSKLKACNGSHQTEITMYKEKLSELEKKQSCLEQEKRELTDRLKELDKKFRNLEKSAEDIIKEKKLYQDNCHSIQSDFEKLTLKFSQIEKENLNLRNDVRNLHTTYHDRVQQSLSCNQDLKRVISELNETLDSRNQEIISCKQLFEEEKAKHKAEICDLNKSMQSDITTVNMALEAATAKHQEEINNLKGELNKNEKLICELNEELHRKKSELKKVEISKNKMEMLENDHQKLIEKLEDLERMLRGCKEAKELAEKEYYLCVEQKEKDKENLRNQLNQLQKETEKQNKEYEEKIVHLNNIIETLTKTNQEKAREFENEIHLLKNESRNVGDKAKEFDMLQAEVEKLNAEVKLLKEENEEQKSLHKSSVEDLKSKILLYTEREKPAEKEMASLKSTIVEKCHLVTERDERIVVMTSEINQLKEEICSLIERKKELSDTVAKNEKTCDVLTIDMLEGRLQKQNMELELLKLNEEAASFQQINEALRKQLKDMENTIISKDSYIKNLTAENELLKKEIKQQGVTHADISEHYTNTLAEQNFVDMNSTINVDELLERVEFMVQSINDSSKIELLALITELKENMNLVVTKLSFLHPIPAEHFTFAKHKIADERNHKDNVTKCNTELQKTSSFGSEEKRAALNKVSLLSEKLQLLRTELMEKDKKLNMLEMSHSNQICEMKEKLLNMEAAHERKYKKLVGGNLQLEEKLQNLEVKHEKLNLDKQKQQKELAAKEKEIEDLQHKLNQEAKSRKTVIDLHQEEIQKLKNAERVRRNEYCQEFRNEIAQLQTQVKESEQKNEDIQNKLRHERDILYKKYEGAKKLISSLQEEKKETSEKFSANYRKYQEVKTQLSDTQTELEKKIKETKRLLTQLRDEQTRLVPLKDKIKKQETLLQQEMKEKATLKAQLDLAERHIKELKQLNEIGNIFDQATGTIPSSDNSCNELKRKPKYSSRIVGNKENVAEDKPSRKSMRMSTALLLTEIEFAAKNNVDDNGTDPNLSTSTRYSEFMQNSIVSTPGSSINRPLPAGTGFQFLCEDEDGEFMNHSYLGDLKAGRCVVEDRHLKRISELQRRNTLCLPHLQSSYPVETQMHASTHYTDDALKAGVAVNDSILRPSDTNSKIPVKYKQVRSPSPRKRKLSPSAKQNPRLSTPSKKSSNWSKIYSPRIRGCCQNENEPPSTPNTSRKSVFKTPSSLQRFFKHRPLRASKEANVQKDKRGSRRINM